MAFAVGLLQSMQHRYKHMDFYVNLAEMVTVILMILIFMFQWQTFLLLENQKNTIPYSERSPQLMAFHLWVTLEILLVLSIALGNLLFLFTRSLTHNTISAMFKSWDETHSKRPEERKEARAQKDFLKAEQLTLGLFTTWTNPLLISIFLRYVPALPFYEQASAADKSVFDLCLAIQGA